MILRYKFNKILSSFIILPPNSSVVDSSFSVYSVVKILILLFYGRLETLENVLKLC
jgi:hypothetical protein